MSSPTRKESVILPPLVSSSSKITGWVSVKIDLKSSPYKDLQQTLRVSGAQIIAQHSSPLGFISVVESSEVPFRYATGLSLNFPAEIPRQIGVFVDGNGPLVINQGANKDQLEYMQHMTTALP